MPNVLSIFSGSGGLDLGFHLAGFNIVGSIELEEWACNSLRKNFPQNKVIGPPDISGDISEWSSEDLLAILKLKKKDIDLIIGGPPCQPFSQAASQRFLASDKRYKRIGFDDKRKGNLLFEFIRLIIDIKPNNFVIENVPGLLKIDEGIHLKKALSILKEKGDYEFSDISTTKMELYGLPQFRERLIIWGSRRKKNCSLPSYLLTEKKNFQKNLNSCSQVLLDIPKKASNHTTRNHLPSSIDRYKKLRFGQREKLGRVDRLNPFLPSKTVIAGGMNGGGRSHLHPFLARTLTVRECARIQTYPDHFEFSGSIARQFTQVGNSVPPLYASYLASKILKDEYEITVDQEFLLRSLAPSLLRQTSIEESVNNLFKQSVIENNGLIYDDSRNFSIDDFLLAA